MNNLKRYLKYKRDTMKESFLHLIDVLTTPFTIICLWACGGAFAVPWFVGLHDMNNISSLRGLYFSAWILYFIVGIISLLIGLFVYYDYSNYLEINPQ